MSDPVTNVEIEDVLSSIRRLVSADDRPEKEAPQEDAAADKLVLTPALRVDNDTAPESDDSVADEAGFDAASDDQHAADESVDTGEARDHDVPEDVWDDGGVDDEDTSQSDAPQNDGLDDDPEEEIAGDPEESAVDAGEIPGATSVLTAHIAEIEDAVAAREDDWEPDGEIGDDNAAQPMTALPWQDHLATDTGQPEGPMAASETEGLDPFVPEDDPSDDAEFYAEEVVADDPAPAAKPGNAFLAEDDLLEEGAEAIIDEDTLRDLVTEIVRQELQGSLGERITRNVRKLVRREIQRALAAQELE
ncbi:hypothetical protein [Roseovarius sp. 2305UL8-3]|uniref:hypothetical protein n=1 Tax=Roseovarius conchicola TaxID=3121636 RepID=UPI0035288418